MHSKSISRSHIVVSPDSSLWSELQQCVVVSARENLLNCNRQFSTHSRYARSRCTRSTSRFQCQVEKGGLSSISMTRHCLYRLKLPMTSTFSLKPFGRPELHTFISRSVEYFDEPSKSGDLHLQPFIDTPRAYPRQSGETMAPRKRKGKPHTHTFRGKKGKHKQTNTQCPQTPAKTRKRPQILNSGILGPGNFGSFSNVLYSFGFGCS